MNPRLTRRDMIKGSVAFAALAFAQHPLSSFGFAEPEADGEVLSLDPDIPSANQRVIFTAEPAGKNLQWRLLHENIPQQIANGRWQPQAGRYRLALANGRGDVLDEVGFEVRGGRQN